MFIFIENIEIEKYTITFFSGNLRELFFATNRSGPANMV